MNTDEHGLRRIHPCPSVFIRGCLFLLAFVVPSLARAEMPALLDQAIRKWVADEDHWAYTQRIHFRNGLSGSVKNRVERFDPSLPIDEQWTLLMIDGRTPTEGDIRSWKRQKLREMQRRERPLSDYFELDRATVAEETAEVVRYDVPLRTARYRRVPLDKLAVSITVNKKSAGLVSLVAGLKESFRVGMGFAKVTDADLEIRFKTIDPQYAPQPEFIRATGSGRVVFLFKVGADADVDWSEFRRVVPFKARYDVQIGELRALGF